MPTPPLDWKDVYDNINRPDTALGVITVIGGMLFMLKKIFNAVGLDIVKKNGNGDGKVNTRKTMKDLEPRVVRLESTIVGLAGCEKRQQHCQKEIGEALKAIIEQANTNGKTSQENAVTLSAVNANIDWIKTELERRQRADNTK